MARIFTAGESLIDLIFTHGDKLVARAGGSALNTSVSLGRLGAEVEFITEYGTDRAGDFIHHFLLENQVGTHYIKRYGEGQTALALAFLDEKQEARYSFYKNYPAQRLDVPVPGFRKGDLFLFGSIYAISEPVHEKVYGLASLARKKGALILYDPNFRESHLPQLPEVLPRIRKNMESADIVRASDEDMKNIFGTTSAEECFQKHLNPEQVLIYTQGSRGAELVFREGRFHFPANAVKAVSTIGAGDTFNAGILYALSEDERRDPRSGLRDLSFWEQSIPFAMDCAGQVCISLDNYISREYARSVSGKGR